MGAHQSGLQLYWVKVIVSLVYWLAGTMGNIHVGPEPGSNG
jgi:hypothetical protein